MSFYCINPRCSKRKHENLTDNCPTCGTQLSVRGRFRLISPLKAFDPRSQSEVFVVEDSHDNKQYVLKVVHATGESRADDEKRIELHKRESGVLVNFSHPGIPEASLDAYFEFETGMSEKLYCVVMSFIEGIDLLEWLEVNGKLSSERALDWLRQLTQIIHSIHTLGVFHRDIKPENIILKPNGQLVIVDFGAVREVSETYRMKMSADPSKMGSRAKDFEITRIYSHGYAAPEQLDGRATPQSDFFAIASTLVHLLTGTHPRYLPKDPDTSKLLWREQAPNTQAPLARYLDKLLERDPAKRPTNTTNILKDLEKLPKQIKYDRFYQSKWVRLAAITTTIAICVLGAWRVRLSWSDSTTQEGIVLLSQNRHREAEEKFRLALNLNKDNYLAYNKLASTCFEYGNLNCALENYMLSISKGSKTSKWRDYANVARVYDDLNNVKLARQYYQKSIENSNGKEVYPLNNLARIDILEGNPKKAEQELKPSLSRLNLLLKEKLKRNRSNSNEREREIIELKLEKVAVLKNLGWAALMQQTYKPASNYLKEAITIQDEVLQESRESVTSAADPYCLLIEVQKQIGKIERETRKNCLLLETDTPEIYELKLKHLDTVSIHLPNA